MSLEIPVVRTKIIIPRRRTEILSRSRLLTILDNILELKLLILAAPAGYGKTSLLIDFAYHTQLPVCWYALDPLDNDPKRFIAHFIASIALRFPEFGEASNSALRNMDHKSSDFEPVISAIINDVYDHVSEHFVFVLDDYHLVRDTKPIDAFINRISLDMAENCHLVIASRTLLTLPDLTLLVARSQVGGLSFEELAFLPEEIKQLLSVNYNQNITDSMALDLEKQTEGWVTGLLLTAQLSPKDTKERLRLARVSGIGLYEYLAQQVLDRQPDSMKLFLMRTSLFEEFDSALCERILSPVLLDEKIIWSEQIDIILRDNLFVLPVDDVTLHLRYHHLFRDFLQNRMRVERPEETLQIEKELAKYYEEQRDWERVYSIYSRIGDVDHITDVIKKAAPTLILNGRLDLLADWINTLPEQVQSQKPELISINGTIAMMRGDSRNSLALMDKAIDGLRENKNQYDLAITLIRRSSINRYFGNYEQAQKDAHEALDICNVQTGMEKNRAEALRTIGINFYQLGELKKALAFLEQSLEQYQLMNEKMDAAKVLMDLGVVRYVSGDLDESENAYQNSLEYWQATQNSLWQANLHNNIGVLQHSRGKFDQAALSLEKAIAHARVAANPRLVGYSLTSLGDLYRDIRALPEARQAYLMADEACRSADDLGLSTLLIVSRSILERVSKNFNEAKQLLGLAQERAEKSGSKFEINLCRLENCILQSLHKINSNNQTEFTELIKFFKEEGYKAELLRAKYYASLISKPNSKNQKAYDDFYSLIRSAHNDLEKVVLVQAGLESFELIPYDHSSDPDKSELSDFKAKVKAFDESLIHLRRTIRRHSEVVRFDIPRFSIKAFGKCQVKIGDHSVALSEWKTQMARDVFFFILNHPEGITKEEIGEEFWSETTIDTIRLRFKNSMYRIRRAVGAETITFVEDNYRFNRSIEYEYDVENFTQEINAANASSDNDEKIMHLRLAINLYKGPFLPKLDYEWVLIQREQYHQTFMIAISQLIEIYLKAQQYQLVIQYAERAIEEDSCFEIAYRSAMTAFSAIGDRAGVSRQYEKCKAALKKELKIEPAAQTQSLYLSLMQ